MSELSVNPQTIKIHNRIVGPGHPVYIIAEISANHHQDYAEAEKLIRAAKEAGADAVKLQTYTPDTLTIRSDRDHFRIGGGTLWDGRTLYDLYQEAYMPWEWHAGLIQLAGQLQMDCFSTPYDVTALEFLENLSMPVYKVASFELVDIPLIEKIASKGKPIIMSTGMATRDEIKEAVEAAQRSGTSEIALLKCTSAYPARCEDANLKTIPDMSRQFGGLPIGISDHTEGHLAVVAAVALGACIIEKHFTLSRKTPGPDSSFSMEPAEFKAMVEAVRTCEKALGTVSYGVSKAEEKSRIFRRSLFAVKNIKKGESFTSENMRSIRPGYGLPPKYYTAILGQKAACDIEAGTALSQPLISGFTLT